MSDVIMEIYEKNSNGAKRCEAIVRKISERIAGVTPEVCEEYGFEIYESKLPCNGWVTLTISPRPNWGKGETYYSIMKHDNERHKVSSLDLIISDDGRHTATAYHWAI